jgi:hypothetical protein
MTTDQEDEGMAARTSVCKIQLQHALDKVPAADMKLMVGDEWVMSAHSSVLIARSRLHNVLRKVPAWHKARH